MNGPFGVGAEKVSTVKEIIFAKVGDYFTHYLLENGDIIYSGYTQFKKLSGNGYPWKLAKGDQVLYIRTGVQTCIGKKCMEAISRR